jgi:hypothetical protein
MGLNNVGIYEDVEMKFTAFEIRQGAYYDSVVLMQLQRELRDLSGVLDAGVVMAKLWLRWAHCYPVAVFPRIGSSILEVWTQQ